MGMAVAGGKLHEAEPVTARVKPHGLGIDGDHRAEIHPLRQIMAMEMDFALGH
jgi:hypothetical protein